jgi:phosphotriesterase-related protein
MATTTALPARHPGGKNLYQVCALVLERGAYVEFDDFGKEFYIISEAGDFAGGAFATDVDRVRCLKTLCGEGYAERILLTNDVCLKTMLHAYGGWGYDHVLANVAAMMRNEGIGPADIDRMLRKNPIAFLS